MKPRSIGAPSFSAGPGNGFPPSVTTQNPRIQSACWQPLLKGPPPFVSQPASPPPAAPPRLARGGNDHVRAVLVDLIEGLRRQVGHEDGGPSADHRRPADRTVDSA